MPKKQKIYSEFQINLTSKSYTFLHEDSLKTLMKNYFWLKKISSDMKWSQMDMTFPCLSNWTESSAVI